MPLASAQRARSEPEPRAVPSYLSRPAGKLHEESGVSGVGLHVYPATVREHDLLHYVEPEAQALTATQLSLATTERVEEVR